jgi:hypothetical protein
MDPDRFDTLAKRFVTPTTRRATLGGLAAGGLLSALGLGRAIPETRAAQPQTCTLAFVATVRLGASAQQALTTNGTQPGELRGDLSFHLSERGSLENATLLLGDGTSLPVVGEANGHSLQMRIDLGGRLALVAVGVGEKEVATCRGAIDGLVTGPQVGDLGDWHAAVLRQTEGAGGAGSTGASTGGSGQTGAKKSTPTPVPAGGSSACLSGLTRCNGVCVDLSTNSNHCGACGEVCPGIGGLVCTGGRCGCPPGWTDCSQAPNVPQGTEGYCADLRSNTGNCGACGFSCAAGQTCDGGHCRGSGAAQCAAGLTDCSGTCVDLQSDANNCGACNGVCPSFRCEKGVCTTDEPLDCGPGKTDCDGVCVDLQTDMKHCGACGEVCESGLVGVECRSGVCERADCPVGITYCGATALCRDLKNDDEHCGACGNVCGQVPQNPGVFTYCENGTCVAPQCPAGTTDCSNYCADLQTSTVHCGVCGKACAAGETCVNGVCTAPVAKTACAQQGQPCGAGGCCVGYCNQDDICKCASDGSQCAQIGTGGCCSGQPCNADGFCGACATLGATCASDGDCCSGGQYAAACCFDGVRLASVCTDVTNIGFVCPGTNPAPAACPGGQTDCGGACVDLLSHAGHCGACFNSCPLGGICAGGTCQGDAGGGGGGCVALGSACTYGVDICCGGACLNGVCACSPPRDVCADGSTCCSGVCGGDGFCT